MTHLSKDDILLLKKHIYEKGINYLTHYTNINNLPSILNKGLMTIDTLKKREISFMQNDEIRVDNTNAICLNIEFPNYKLFYKNRITLPDLNWAVILLDSKILFELDVAFCKTNAANHNVNSIPICERQTVSAFLDMFYDNENNDLRSYLNLPKNYTTDPQAEILVFETIPVDYIVKIFFQNNDLVNEYKSKYNFNIQCSNEFFNARNDYDFWK